MASDIFVGQNNRHPKCSLKTFNENLESQIVQLNKDKKD